MFQLGLSIMGRASRKQVRFLNMDPKQMRRRYKTSKQRQYREALLQIKPQPPLSKARSKTPTVRKARPCCGLLVSNCVCKPHPGIRKLFLKVLCRRFAKIALSSVQDATDVSTLRTLMARRCQTLPLRQLLANAHTHVVFNQDHLLRSFIDQKAFLFKPPWFDWHVLQSIMQEVKQRGQPWRSSNYRSTTLRELRVPSHCGQARVLQSSDGIERAVLACKVLGEDAGSVRSKSQPGFVESISAHVAGASPQQMLRMLRPLLLEVCTRPRLRCTQIRPCHYLMVVNRVPCVSTLVRATLPRQKPDFRGVVSSIVHDLPRTESHKNL